MAQSFNFATYALKAYESRTVNCHAGNITFFEVNDTDTNKLAFTFYDSQNNQLERPFSGYFKGGTTIKNPSGGISYFVIENRPVPNLTPSPATEVVSVKLYVGDLIETQPSPQITITNDNNAPVVVTQKLDFNGNVIPITIQQSKDTNGNNLPLLSEVVNPTDKTTNEKTPLVITPKLTDDEAFEKLFKMASYQPKLTTAAILNHCFLNRERYLYSTMTAYDVKTPPSPPINLNMWWLLPIHKMDKYESFIIGWSSNGKLDRQKQGVNRLDYILRTATNRSLLSENQGNFKYEKIKFCEIYTLLKTDTDGYIKVPSNISVSFINHQKIEDYLQLPIGNYGTTQKRKLIGDIGIASPSGVEPPNGGPYVPNVGDRILDDTNACVITTDNLNFSYMTYDPKGTSPFTFTMYYGDELPNLAGVKKNFIAYSYIFGIGKIP